MFESNDAASQHGCATSDLVSLRPAALAYARAGRKILPLWWIDDAGHCACGKSDDAKGHRPGKHPIGALAPNGSASASNDLRLVAEYWSERPFANIGGLTGKEAGLVVFDVDRKDGGLTTWQEILAEHNNAQPFETITARTGNDGLHVSFAHPGETVRSFRHGGIDVLADREGEPPYVVLPPSLHVSGKRYRWITPPGTRLLPYRPLLTPTIGAERKAYQARGVKRGDGQFWPAMYSFGRLVANACATPEEISAALLAHHDAPGFCGDDGCKLSEATIERIDKLSRELFAEQEAEPAKPAAKAYAIDDLTDVLHDTLPDRPPDLIKDIVPAGARHIEVLGQEGHGKTMLMEIAALQAAVGRPVFDYYPVVRPLRVIFLQDDSPEDLMRRREAAIIRYMRLSERARELLRSNYLPIREQGFVFSEPESLRQTLEHQRVLGRPVDLVMVDSRTSAWPFDPNDVATAREIYLHKMRPICRDYGTPFIIIGHPPKPQPDASGRLQSYLTIAGTVVHQRNADVIIHVRQEANYPPRVSFEFAKVRDGIKGMKTQFEAVIEPEPQPSNAFDGLSAFVPRGWVALTALDGAGRTILETPVHRTLDALIPFILERPRAVAECADHIKGLEGYCYGRRTVEDALALGVRRGLLVNPNGRGKAAEYRLTGDGLKYTAQS